MTPFDDDWCKWRLQEVYDYNVGEDYLILDNKYYYYGSCTYNSNNNNTFTVTLKAMTNIKERVEEIVDSTLESVTVDINTYDVMKYSTVVATKDAVRKIEEVFA